MASETASSKELRAPAPRRPLISVVVPTRDRPVALESCLAALSAQTVGDRLEVIVVDDGSTNPTEISSIVARYACARLVRHAAAGPAAARNVGAHHSRGAILCFTDDDCVPQADWAGRLEEAIRRGADAVAGSTLSAGGALADASELIANAPAAAQTFAPSNNLACRRAAFEAIPFDQAYPDAAAEDRDWCARLVAEGFVLGGQPAARVVHRQALTLATFLRRQVRYGEGAYRFRRLGPVRRDLEPPRFYTALLRQAFAHGVIVGLLVSLAQAATALGFVRAWARTRGR